MQPPRVKPAPPPPDASCPGSKHKGRKRTGENTGDASFYNLDLAASATECTGALAAQVQSDDEAESISRLAGIHQIKPAEGEKGEREG